MAVERELADERVHLPQGDRHRWTAIEIAAEKAIRGDAEIERAPVTPSDPSGVSVPIADG